MARPISFDPELALEEAIELFWLKGYHNVSVEDIVENTGLNRHSLYVRFGSKLGLLRAALARYNRRANESLEAVCRATQSVRARLIDLLSLREKGNSDPTFRKISERGCFALCIGTELRDSHPEFRTAMDLMGRTIERRILSLIREGQQTGEIRKDCPPEDLANMLVGVFMLPLVYNQEQSHPRDSFVSLLSAG